MMNMQRHMVAALREQLVEWQQLIGGLGQEQLNVPLSPSEWTMKDMLAHLMAWQQLTLSRLAAAIADREPVYPDWAGGKDPDQEPTDPTNARIYDSHRGLDWPTTRDQWQVGYERIIELAERIPERDLLDPDRYPWLNGCSLADVLLGTYGHHLEHHEILSAWLSGAGSAGRRP